MAKQNFTSPVGRMVAGSLYKGSDKDLNNQPRLIKNGPNKGQPTTQFFFALAIPKTPGLGWWQEPWGQIIYGVGSAAFPQACQSPAFAWKIDDGDSTVPNKRGKKPCDQEGWRGHWVLKFSSTFPPKVFNREGTEQILTPDFVKPGYFIQVFGSVDGNSSDQTPGIYLNHIYVAFVAYGDEIISGPDATAVGFGQNVTLPPGASATPMAGAFNPAAPGVPGAPGMPGMPTGAVPGGPGAPAMPGLPYASGPAMPGMPTSAVPAGPAMGATVGTPMMPGMPTSAPTTVQPHPQFLAVPGGAPVMPPPAPVRQMTAKANGYTYEQLISMGWTDQVLIQQGVMLA